jgi:hypothetical protein
MSGSPLVLLSALLGAGLLCSTASAQNASPFAGADCREAKLDKVLDGKVLSSDTVIVCKRTEQLRTALHRDGVRFAPEQAAAAPAHVAFTAPVAADRECAMLNCPTYILTGVGD